MKKGWDSSSPEYLQNWGREKEKGGYLARKAQLTFSGGTLIAVQPSGGIDGETNCGEEGYHFETGRKK